MQSTLSVVATALAKGIAPPPEIDPVAWAADNIVVPDGPYAGQRWDPSLFPPQTEILQVLSPRHPCTRVTVRKSAQTGVTGLGIIWLGLIACHYPAAVLAVQPTLAALKKFNADKLQPTIDQSPALRRRIARQKSRDGDGSTALSKRFPGGSIRLTIANSSADLRSATVRFALCDEIDEWPEDLEGQGDPMAMVDARQIAFHRTGDFKKVEISTPTLAGASRIDTAFEAGDQRWLQLACPHCDEWQFLEFEQLRGETTWPHQVHYVCRHCGCALEEHDKTAFLKRWRFVPASPEAGRHPSFQLSAIESPFTTWDAMWQAWLAAQEDPHKLKTFDNLWLGRSHEVQGEAPEWQHLRDRAALIAHHDRGEIPAAALFLTAGIDVQWNRLEVVLLGIGVGKTLYVVDHAVLEGDTADVDVWNRLTAWLFQARWDTAGHARRIDLAAADSGDGNRTAMVYKWVRGKHNVIAIKGRPGIHDWPISNGKDTSYKPRGRNRTRRARLFDVSPHFLKSELYGKLNLQGPDEAGQFPPGFVHLPTGMPDDFFQQLTSQKLVTVEKRGGGTRLEWQKTRGVRDEVLDCTAYALGAAYHPMVGIGAMTPEMWARKAAERGVPAEEEQLDLLRGMALPKAVAAQQQQSREARIREMARRMNAG